MGAASPQSGSLGRIAEGIGLVTSAGTVKLTAGEYVENVVVNKSLTLLGAGELATTIVPAASNPNPCYNSSLCGGTASNIILVQADNVTVHDMTLDGDNPLLTSGIEVGGADLDARNGIISNSDAGTFNLMTVYNCTVRNIYLRGIYAASGGSFNFHHNTVTNVQANPSSIGMFAWGGPGTMADNTVSLCNDAISANHSKGIQFLRNTVTNSASGIHTDNSGDGGGAADLIQGNIVTDGAPNSYGILDLRSLPGARRGGQYHYELRCGPLRVGPGGGGDAHLPAQHRHPHRSPSGQRRGLHHDGHHRMGLQGRLCGLPEQHHFGFRDRHLPHGGSTILEPRPLCAPHDKRHVLQQQHIRQHGGDEHGGAGDLRRHRQLQLVG